MTNKTITIATKGGVSRAIARHKQGWNLPPEDGRGAYINGTGAYRESVTRWRELGWTVNRKPDPNYRPLQLFAFTRRIDNA